MDYIRRSYGVPAKRGARVTWWGCTIEHKLHGTIVGARDQYLRVRFDDEAGTRTLHPTFLLAYHETPNKDKKEVQP